MQFRPDLLRKMNERQVFNLIRRESPISRVEIARVLDVALPTVSRIVDDLIERGWVQTARSGDSSGGRPPTLVEINPNGAGAIGIDLGREFVRIVYTDLLGTVKYVDEWPLAKVDGPSHLVRHVSNFMASHQLAKERIVGIGIAAPGPLDARQGVLLSPDHIPPAWQNVQVVSPFQDGLGIPCYLSNDANAAALAESWFGAGKDAGSAVFVLADVGLGAGIVLDGRIWNGEGNMAGEFSHMIIAKDGRPCQCGRTGCVNTYASLPAIEASVAQVRGKRMPFSEIVRQAADTTGVEREILSEAAYVLALAIMNLVQVIDPAVVILGGYAIFAEGSYFFRLVDNALKSLTGFHVPVLRTVFGVNAVCVGAATLALQQIYDPTLLVISE